MKKLPDLEPPDENPGDIGFDDPEVEAAFLASVGARLRQMKARMTVHTKLKPKHTSRQAGSQGAKPRKSSGSK